LIADKEYVLDTTKARTILGWTAKQDMYAALRAAYDWYCSNREGLGRDSEQDFPEEGVLKLLKLIS
jgi:dTDP-D-glucose 4,6-dehydratase